MKGEIGESMKTLTLTSKNDQLIMPKLSFGAAICETESKKDHYFSLMDRYYEYGGNCFDTARVYCSWLKDGANISEKTVGEWAKTKKRKDIIISTKGGHPPFDNLHASRLEEAEILSDFSESLRFLQTDYIDIYFLHRDDVSKPVSQIMPVLHQLVSSGQVRFLGASNWTAARIAQANQYAQAHGLTPFSISQINYSLAVTTPQMTGDDTLVCMKKEEYAWYTENNFPVMAFTSQAKGFFSKYLEDSNHPGLDNRLKTSENLLRAERVKKLCSQRGCSPAAITLSYLTCNKLPVSAVTGFRTMEQLEDSMSETSLFLSEEEIQYLEGK